MRSQEVEAGRQIRREPREAQEKLESAADSAKRQLRQLEEKSEVAEVPSSSLKKWPRMRLPRLRLWSIRFDPKLLSSHKGNRLRLSMHTLRLQRSVKIRAALKEAREDNTPLGSQALIVQQAATENLLNMSL